jgi:hypothetical protein
MLTFPFDASADDQAFDPLIRQALSGYDEPLLRRVAGRLLNPRSYWPVDHLIERIVPALANIPALDRRLRSLPPACRQLLALVALSQQPWWSVAGLVELLASLGQRDGLAPLVALMEEGYLLPEVEPSAPAPIVRDFETHLAGALNARQRVWFVPAVVRRCRQETIDWPALEPVGLIADLGSEADGFDWPTRLSALWQEAALTPFRLTLSGGLFKRDVGRLREDGLLNRPSDHATEVPAFGSLLVEVALQLGLLQRAESELVAGTFGPVWRGPLVGLLGTIWVELLQVQRWNPVEGWLPDDEGSGSLASAYVLLISLLHRQAPDDWLELQQLRRLIEARHPRFGGGVAVAELVDTPTTEQATGQAAERASERATEQTTGMDTAPDTGDDWASRFVAAVAWPLRLVQLARSSSGQTLVRLTPWARAFFSGGKLPSLESDTRQTLTVQPTGELLVFRQGLTPDLIRFLAQTARWKAIGHVCQLELNAEMVYRSLEAGNSFESIMQTLERCSVRPIPESIASLIKTWANKRERVAVYADCTLLEFATPAELEQAQARGLIRTRLTDTIGLAGPDIDYRHLRVVSNRDYEAPPEQCVTLGDDGLTLQVDTAVSDLLLDSELQRIAQPLPGRRGDVRLYQLTQESLQRALASGLSLAQLEQWFLERTGGGMSSAARLLLTASRVGPVQVGRQVVVEVPTAEVAEGLLQLPQTRALIARRLGATALVVAEPNLPQFLARLQEIGLSYQLNGDSPST